MAASSQSRALPLLSTIAPRTEHATTSPSCHRCSKEFGILTRRKICCHCGYPYCSSCCDHQAVCPRSDASYSPGYDTVLVCTYCIEMLSITASGKSQLRSMPVVKLRDYLDAYGIKPKSIVEKDDLIEAIIDARSLSGGLSSDHERFYRRQTIANRPPADSRNRNMFSTYGSRPSAPVPPPRPRSTDPRVTPLRQPPASQPSRPSVPPRGSDPTYQQQQYPRPMSPRNERPPPVNTTWSPPSGGPSQQRQAPWPASASASPPPQPRWQTRPQSPPPPTSPQESFLRPPSAGRSRSRSVPSSEAPYPPYGQANSPPPPPPPSSRPRAPVAVPLLATLLDKSREDISQFNVSSLKGILQANHVNARLILEKSELVEKVMGLIEVEKRDRAREQAIHEAEERAAQEQRQRMEQMRQDAERRARASASGSTSPTRVRSPPPTRPTSPRPSPAPTTGFVERDGLCVICQDEEANVAIVDCGHLCLCMACSDTIMKSTKECPLCRTRIVTEQRLLRIFRA